MQLRDTFYYSAGLGFLALAKTKNILNGYITPKTFDLSETDRCIDYDINVVDHWINYLNKYTDNNYSIEGKNILELGPGFDLGIGIYLLSKGCSKYNACDVNNLMDSTPDSFYENLFLKIGSNASKSVIDELKEQLNNAKKGLDSKLNYVVRDDFDLVSAFGESQFDLVFSQAAFEHFDDIQSTISQLTKVCKPNAIMITEIDLKTHSRWIRDKDPNNIYRYPNWIYDTFRFRGIPNRFRPNQYKEILQSYGWNDIQITSLTQVDDPNNCYSGLNSQFTSKHNQMEYLTIMLSARKKWISNSTLSC